MYLKGGENMDTVNFLFQQNNVSVPNSNHSMKGSKGQTNRLFEASLEEQLGNGSMPMKDISQSNRIGTENEAGQLIKMFLGGVIQPSETMNTLLGEGEKLEELEEQAEMLLSGMDGEEDIKEISAKLLHLLEQWSSIAKPEDELVISTDETNRDSISSEILVEMLENIQASLIDDDKPLENIEDQLENLLDWLNNNPINLLEQATLFQNLKTQVEHILKQQNLSESSIDRLTFNIEQLLDRSLKKDGVLKLLNPEISEDKATSKEKAIWQELVQNYQKRKELASTYRTNASVETSDISKWLSHSINKQTTTNQNNITQSSGIGLTSLPMSQIEQYVIHVNQMQSSSSVDQQVIDQIEKIMASSKFLSQPNGRMQLSMMLRPENLGEMRVHFTQMDGEMVVKIAVNSGATKDLLERNLHQLRNVFSPHQVVVERQEINLQQSADVPEEQNDESFNDQDNNAQQNHDENQHNDDSNEVDFREILMNEKV